PGVLDGEVYRERQPLNPLPVERTGGDPEIGQGIPSLDLRDQRGDGVYLLGLRYRAENRRGTGGKGDCRRVGRCFAAAKGRGAQKRNVPGWSAPGRPDLDDEYAPGCTGRESWSKRSESPDLRFPGPTADSGS